MARCLALLIALLLASRSLAADRDTEFVGGLRRLQLFDLAEKYCRRELALQGNSVEREALLTIELIRSFALEAMSKPPEQRDPIWKQARDAAAEFQRTHTTHPRLLLIRVQDALTLLAQGELAQQEAEAANAAPAALNAAAAQLRAAAKAFDNVSDTLDKQILLRRTKPPGVNELSSDELARLQFNVMLHLAQAQHRQALCYPPESRDRKALLIATLEALEASVARLEADDELAARMRILQMTCHRELGQLDDAHRIFALLDRDDLSGESRRAGLAEEARIFIAAKRPKEAIALLDDPKRAAIVGQSGPELDLARLEAALAVAKSATGVDAEKERTQWQRAAAVLAQKIDQQHGRAAGRRADQVVAALLPSDATGGNIDLLARVADNLYIKRQIEEAIAAYDKAAAAANTAGNSSREYELRYKAALVEQQEKHFAAAAARFERLAVELKKHPQAAEAHLVACWNKAQQARDDEAAATAYVALLGEHISRWPQAATADQARLWLGQWHQAHERWPEAFAIFAEVSRAAKEFPAAVAAAGQCARQQLAGLMEAGKKPAEAATEYVTFFTGVAAIREGSTKTTTEPARQAALIAAELAMEYVPNGHASAEKTLRAAIAASDKADAAWTSEATSLLIAAIAGQSGRRAEAEKLLHSLASDSGRLLKLLDRLASTSQRASPRMRQDLASLELEVIDRLAADKGRFTPEQLQELERLRAESLAQLGRREEALKAFATMARSMPNNGAVQEAYAELLGQSSEKVDREAALARWRQIAAKSPPRSERWCKAKHAVASLQAQLGDRAAAATLCRFLLETPPGLAETPWQEKFEKLLKEVQ